MTPEARPGCRAAGAPREPRTAVDIPGSWRSRHVRLAFLAVGYSAEVWLDGTYLGKHEGRHDPLGQGQPLTLPWVRPDRQ